MSNDATLGVARLVSVLETKGFETTAKRLETDFIARMKRMGAASEGVLSAKAFAGGASGARAVQRELDPLQKSIQSLKLETQAYRSVVEATDVSNRDAVANFDRLKTSALQLAEGLDVSSRQYKDLVGAAAQASRSMKTLDGEQSRLGFSGNTVVGVTASMRQGFGNLQSAIVPLVGGAGFAGLLTAANSFVSEAQRAESAAVLYGKAVARIGADSSEADALVDDLATTFGILPSTVQDAAIPILRAGGSLEDVSNALRGAGASAAAGGRDIGLAMQNVGRAVATGNSALTEQADIIVNSSDAYKDYADNLGISVDALTEQQKVQAYAAAIFEETKFELADLDSVMTDQVRSQQSFRTAMAEVRQEIGANFAPAMAAGATAAASLLNGFETLPSGAQASVASIGGVTLATSALATGLTALRPLLAATFLPPGGLLVLGAVAASALGVALYQAQQGGEPLADTLARLKTESADLKTGMQTAAEGVATLQAATDKDGLKGSVENLSSLLTGDAKSAFVTLANQAIASGADIDTVTKKILTGFLNAQIELVKLKRDATQSELAAAQKELIQLEGVRGDNTLPRLKEELALQEELVASLREQAAAGDIVAQQDLANNELILAGMRDRISTLTSGNGEITSAIVEQRTEVGALTNVLFEQNKAIDELQAAKADPTGFAEAQQQEATVTETVTSNLEDQTSATSNLADETERLDPALRAVIRAQQEAQKGKLEAYYAEAAVSASDFTTSLDALNVAALEQTEADQAAIQATKDLVAARLEAANQASPYDASGPTALTEALQAAVTASGYMTDAQREANLELRESATSAESFSDSLAGLNEEGRIAGHYFNGVVNEAVDLTTSLDRLNEKAREGDGSFAAAAGSANDYSTALSQLNNQAHEASTGLRNADTSAESLSDSLSSLNNLAHQVRVGDGAADDLENASEKAELLNKAGLEAIEIFGKLATEILGADSAMGIFASTATNAISALASGDILGFFGSIIDGIVNLAKHGQEELDQLGEAYLELGDKAYEFATLRPNGTIEFDEASYNEYLQYLEAIEKYGQDIADRFYEVDEQGKVTFNEDGLEGYTQGLERIQDRADGIAEAMRAAKDATDSVLEAEISADEDTLQAKLDSQDGAYSVDDIFAEQSLAIGRAAQERDEQYRKAAELDAAGQTELANRMRAAADQSFQAELQSINANATQRAEAIGQNSAQFQNDLAQNAASESSRWTDYWNQDAQAQIEAQKQAQIQLRRFQHVLNSERYAEILAATGNEQLAWEQASAELGYTIDATNGNLVTAQDQAAQQQSQSLTNNGLLLTGAAQNLFGGATSQIITDSAILRGQIAGEGSLLSSTVSSIFGGTASVFAGQGGALSSTIASVYSSLIGTATDGSNLFGAALTNGGNLNIGAIADVGNAIGGQVVGSGKAVQSAQVAAANAQIKQAQEAANKFALNEVKFGNEQNRVGAKVATNRVGNINAAAIFQSDALADFWNSLIDTNVEGNQKYARSTTGGTERVGKGNVRRGKTSFGPANLGKLAADLFANASFQAAADYAKPIDPAKYAEQQAAKVKAPGSASGGSVGKGSGSSSSGKGSTGSGGKGSSGGKKDGSTYTGGKSKDYPEGSPGWYQAKMQEIEEQIKKTSSASKIRSLQAQKAKLQAAYDALMGTGKDADKSAPAGSINEIEERLAKAREAFENATTDTARADAAERVKVLEAELKEKRKLLENAAKDAQDAVKGTVISIESPIADLGSLKYLAESVSRSVSALPASISSASTGAAASVTQIPESYTSTVLPSYQAQQDMAVAMGGHVDRFGAHINSFGRFVREFGNYMRSNGKSGSNSSIPVKAKGQGLSDMMLRGL